MKTKHLQSLLATNAARIRQIEDEIFEYVQLAKYWKTMSAFHEAEWHYNEAARRRPKLAKAVEVQRELKKEIATNVFVESCHDYDYWSL